MKRSFVMFSIAFVSLGIPAMLLAYSLSGATDHQTSGPLSDEQMAKIFGGTDCESVSQAAGCTGNITSMGGNFTPDCGGGKQFDFIPKRDDETWEEFALRYQASIPTCDANTTLELLGDPSAQGSPNKEAGTSNCHYSWTCYRSAVLENAAKVGEMCETDETYTTHCVNCLPNSSPNITGEKRYECIPSE